MPTPLEILLDPISLIVLGFYAALLIWETVAPARKLPHVSGWRTRGLISFGIFFYLSTYLPLLWDGWFARFQLFDLTALGTLGGAAVGLLAYEVVAYWWHRSMHSSNVLWRTFHQMHHSAERQDVYGAFWFSIPDMIGWTAAGSLGLVLVVGLTPQAATLAVLTITFLGIFQHANIRTPRWLGYLVQRPESHSIHHGRGIHRYNYADLPIMDLIFGTFRNPHDFNPQTGFYDGASSRVLDMHLLRDVSQPRLPDGERAAV